MSEHQRHTAFLRQCIGYDDTGERHKLEESITELQGNERCMRRAVWLMALLVGLAMAGLCYSAVFLTDYHENLSQFAAAMISKVLCALGLGSLICLVSFLGLGIANRKQLDQRREECRQLAAKVLESRLGKPRDESKHRENMGNGGNAAMSAPDFVLQPNGLVEVSRPLVCEAGLGNAETMSKAKEARMAKALFVKLLAERTHTYETQ
jgi:hypothetical protein